jgi:predicted flap endonuclease-1-like 5' DNA nuclease
MMDVIRDAWPWVLLALVLGLVLGWLTTWLYYRGQVAALERDLAECRRGTAVPLGSKPALNEYQLAEASRTLGKKVRLDDLRIVEGIGPKIERLMNRDGIRTWAELATAPLPRLERILKRAGRRYNMHDPGTWSRQASLLVEARWVEFKELTDRLVGGR